MSFYLYAFVGSVESVIVSVLGISDFRIALIEISYIILCYRLTIDIVSTHEVYLNAKLTMLNT